MVGTTQRATPEAQKGRGGVRFLGRRQRAPSPPAIDLGSTACKLPQWGLGRSGHSFKNSVKIIGLCRVSNFSLKFRRCSNTQNTHLVTVLGVCPVSVLFSRLGLTEWWVKSRMMMLFAHRRWLRLYNVDSHLVPYRALQFACQLLQHHQQQQHSSVGLSESFTLWSDEALNSVAKCVVIRPNFVVVELVIMTICRQARAFLLLICLSGE